MNLYELTRTIPLDPEIVRHSKTFYKNLADYANDDGHGDEKDDSRTVQLVKHLAPMGWKKVGSGAFSTVFIHPNHNYVVKLNKQTDRAFAWYTIFTRRYPNPHFPKIGDMKVVSVEGTKYYMYSMEKLEPIHAIPGLQIRARGMELEDHVKVPIFARALNAIAESYDRPLDKIYRLSPTEEPCYQLLETMPTLVKAARMIGQFSAAISSTQFTFVDIHSKNIMQRKDGTIVISDPLA